MGDKSNIVVQDGERRVRLYGHRMACGAIAHTAHGLRGNRYADPSYLASEIHLHMVAERTGLGGGWGVSARMVDDQHPILVIDSRRDFDAGPGDARADVWFEDPDGTRISAVFAREEFLAIADPIPSFRPSWSDDGSDHDCGCSRFMPDRQRKSVSAQIGEV